MTTQHHLAELAGITLNEAVDVEWTKSRLDHELTSITDILEQLKLKTDRLKRSAASTSDDEPRAHHLDQLLRKTAEVTKILAQCQRTVSDVLRR